MGRALAVIVASIAISLVAPAARAQCPPDEDVTPWVSFEAGDQGPGTSGAPSAGSLALCSSTGGFGDTSDYYRYAFQLRDHDFTLRALVTAIDTGGSGGLVAVVPGVSSTHAARVVAEVYVTPSGDAVLRSSIRRDADGSLDPAIAEIPVTLPVTLELVRQGNEIRTAIAGGATHLSAMVDPQSDLMGPLRVGVAQTSNDRRLDRTASFSRITLTAPEPGASAECVEAEAAMAGAPFRIAGRHLDRVDGVRIAGVPATIAAASSSRLSVTTPDPRSSFLHGPVELSQNGRFERVGTATFVGTAIRRGDVDEDGEVTTEDYRSLCYHVYRSAELECSEAGDVDGDGDRDTDDVDRLRRWLTSGTGAPAAPFDAPAYVEGSLACGQPDRPEIHAILFADGSSIDRPVRQGDDLVIVGAGLPSAERAVVHFGGNEAVPSATSSSTRLGVRIGPVLHGGVQCPRIFDAAPASPGATRFGPAFGAPDGSPLCIAFEPSRIDTHLSGRMVGDQLEIAVPPASLRVGERLRVSLALHLPYVVGQTRGPRAATFDFVVPSRDYAVSLAALADRIDVAINGTDSDECGCEVAPTDVVLEEKLILPPCALLPELPPTPTVPGLPTQIEPTKLIWTQLDISSSGTGPGCEDTISILGEPRRFFWCELEELAQIQGADAPALHQGLPLWESYEPPVADVSPDPRQRSTDDKKILADPLVIEMLDLLYDPCQMALRATQCGADEFFRTWMPSFVEGARILKTFWQPESGLPSSVDASTLYSYDPPGATPRQYLVGMHIGWSIGTASGDDTPPDYFRWSTFWLPANGDTHTKGGAPLSTVYSPHCTVGGGGDRPASLDGTPFAAFEMCTDTRLGEEACGNPWEPGECLEAGPTSCTQCHIDMAKLGWGGHDTAFDLDPLRVGWLTSVLSAYGSAAVACLSDIESDPGSFPEEWIAPSPGADAQMCSVGH